MSGLNDFGFKPIPVDLRHLLSPLAEEIVAAVGWDAANLIFENFCGRRLLVPRGTQESNSKNELENVLGVKIAARFMEKLGGSDMEIPTCHRARLEMLYREIRDRYECLIKGMSSRVAVSRLCASYNYSARQLRQIVDTPCLQARKLPNRKNPI